MFKFDEDNERLFVIDTAIKNNLGDKDEICLFEHISVALDLIDEDFEVVDSCISDGIEFGISTRYPHKLPEKVGTLFFNVDHRFNVKIKESSKYVYEGKRYFAISIKKL